MAGLPPDGDYLVQNHGGDVVISQRHTDEVLLRFDATTPDSCARAQRSIAELVELTDEQRSFAHFWSGYFYACLSHGGLTERYGFAPEPPPEPLPDPGPGRSPWGPSPAGDLFG